MLLVSVHPSIASAPAVATRESPDIQLRRRSQAVTCSACQVTYMASALPETTVVSDAWTCERCESQTK